MMKTPTYLLCAVALAASLAGTAHAATIVNGGFEGGPAAGGNQPVYVGDTTTIAGWTVVNGNNSTTGGGKEIAWLGNGAYGYNTPFDTDYLDLTGYSGSAGDSGVSQTVATDIGAAYTLTFWLGGHPDATPVSVNVYAGTQTMLVSDPLVTGTLAGSTLWTQETFTFVATATSTKVSIIGNNSGQDFIGLDNVSISSAATPVPEPMSWSMMMLGFGLAGTALRRRPALAALA